MTFVFEQVSGTLVAAVDEMDIPVDRHALVTCFGLLDRFSAKLTAAVGDFDAAGAWRDDGATSMTAWLRESVGLSSREASRWARTARRLRELPVTAAAYEAGVLSGGQVQAIVSNLNDEITPLFADAERELVGKLAGMSVRDVTTVMQEWAAAAKDHLQPDPDGEPPLPERSLHLSETLDGRGELSASLDPEGKALTQAALRLAESPDTNSEHPRPPAQRRADALVDIMRFFLDHQTDQRGGRHRPHLNVVVNYETLTGAACPCPHCPGHHTHTPASPGDRANAASSSGSGTATPSCSGSGAGGRLLDGTVLDAATIRRLACDCGIHRVVMAGRSSILDYGWTTRTIPANLWAALVIRDQTCRFPGCDRPPQWCEAHHVQPWEHGGPTAITNLVCLCSRHHHLLHGPGWHARLHPDGTFEVTAPDGRTRLTSPPGRLPDLFQRPPPEDPWPLAA
jgi:Domain of unknown function (DUF222)